MFDWAWRFYFLALEWDELARGLLEMASFVYNVNWSRRTWMRGYMHGQPS
jgi:hypothetical protein